MVENVSTCVGIYIYIYVHICFYIYIIHRYVFFIDIDLFVRLVGSTIRRLTDPEVKKSGVMVTVESNTRRMGRPKLELEAYNF